MSPKQQMEMNRKFREFRLEEDINEEDKSTNPVIVNKTQQEVVKNPVKTEGDIKKSRAFDRVKERLGNEYQNLEANYNKLTRPLDTSEILLPFLRKVIM